jgi:hypothetical protein
LGGGAVDFGSAWLAYDEDFLFFRVEVGVEIDPSEDNVVRIYVDTDDTANVVERDEAGMKSVTVDDFPEHSGARLRVLRLVVERL